jgi:hypothetical protein
MKLHAIATAAVMVALAAGQVWAADCGAEVKLRVLGGRPVADCVFLNGQGPYRFLLDTGAQANQLDLKVARAAGLEPNFQADMMSVAGTAKVSGREGFEVALGSVKADQQRFLFSGMEAVQQLASDIQGVLGEDFFSHFDYLLDLQHKRLEFGKVDAPGTRVEFRTTHGLPAIPTSLGALLLDSGAGQVVLFGVSAGRMEQKVGTVAGTAAVGLVSGKQLVIAGREIRYGQAVAVPSQNENVDASGLLPAGLFKVVYVSNSEGYVVLN